MSRPLYLIGFMVESLSLWLQTIIMASRPCAWAVVANAKGRCASVVPMDDSDLSTFRTERLQEAIVRVSSGNKTAFGRKLGFKDGAFIRQMLNGERAITEKTVRAIESLQGMKGWFTPDPTLLEKGILVEKDWPLKMSTPDRFRALTSIQAQHADIAFDAILRCFEAERALQANA